MQTVAILVRAATPPMQSPRHSKKGADDRIAIADLAAGGVHEIGALHLKLSDRRGQGRLSDVAEFTNKHCRSKECR
jgi:hypothetical protein